MIYALPGGIIPRAPTSGDRHPRVCPGTVSRGERSEAARPGTFPGSLPGAIGRERGWNVKCLRFLHWEVPWGEVPEGQCAQGGEG